MSHRAILIYRFVDDVPAFDSSLVTADNRRNVIAQSSQKRLAIQRLSFFIFKHPTWRLVVPDQRVPDDEHVVLFAKLNKAIRTGEVVRAGLRMDQRPFQDILRSDGIEMGLYDLGTARVFFGIVIWIECSADQKIIFEYFLQWWLLAYRKFFRKRSAHKQAKHAKSN